MSEEPVLRVDDLRTTFHTPRGDVRAVDGASLRLWPGETLGVVGESGSGKSVLGRSSMGLITTAGDVTVSGSAMLAGNDVHAVSAKERRRLWGPEIAMVFQDPMTSLNPVKRIGRHLSETLRLHLGLGRREARERAAELLAEVGIPEPARRCGQYPHELSGGMRQRVVIAIALACAPKVLIADEPTTALDVTVQKQILDLLQSLGRRHDMATLLISHDLGAISGRADRVTVMYAGQVVESADTAAVFTRPAHPYAHGLIGAIPRLSATPHTALDSIGGQPPDLASPPVGCRFAPRCGRAAEICATDPPELRDLADVESGTDVHRARCHFPVSAATTASSSQRTPEAFDMSGAALHNRTAEG